MQRYFPARDRPGAADTLADIYHDIRDGLGFRKTRGAQGAFPTDPYSHTPGHLGAQQPGMTGQVKEQVLTRFGELGVEVHEGCVHFEPRLVPRSELLGSPARARFVGIDDGDIEVELRPGSLAFTYCEVPVIYREGDIAAIELEHVDGERELVPGTVLDRPASRAIQARGGGYRRVTVTILLATLHDS